MTPSSRSSQVLGVDAVPVAKASPQHNGYDERYWLARSAGQVAMGDACVGGGQDVHWWVRSWRSGRRSQSGGAG